MPCGPFERASAALLRDLRAQALRQIPVVVLTTSDHPADILKAYDLQASCYVTKPPDLAEFNRVMRTIHDFCLTVVQLPPRG
jgi:DNA-binding NarL/FixJ family response regulator